MIIRALVTAIVAVLIFILAAKMVPLSIHPYLLPLLILLTLTVTAYAVRRQQHELRALQQIDALREQIRLSRTRTRRFLIIVAVAGALDLLVWRIDAHIASTIALGLFVFSIVYFLSRIPAAVRFGKEQFAEQVKREIDPVRDDK
jgi:hypothetical protein